MEKIAFMCPLTADQYADLFAVGTEDRKLVFTTAILEKGDFKKIAVDYNKFIAMAVARFQCGLAATVVLKYKLPDSILEALFLNPKCFGGNLREVSLELVPTEKVYWFFQLSLEAQEYTLARNLVEKFKMGDQPYVYRIIDAAIADRSFDEIIDFDPPEDWDKRFYQDEILERIMALNEEWFIARYVVLGVENGNAWIERAYLHALRRGAFELAAEIAHKYEGSSEFSEWGINLAFESACQANIEEAEQIARRWLDSQARGRVAALLYQQKMKEATLKYQKKKEEERKRKKRACKTADNWCVTPVK